MRTLWCDPICAERVTCASELSIVVACIVSTRALVQYSRTTVAEPPPAPVIYLHVV